MGFEGDLCEGFGLYGAQEAFGQARFPPQPSKKIVLQGFSPFPGVSGEPPGPPWCLPIALCGPMGLFCPVWGPAAVI